MLLSTALLGKALFAMALGTTLVDDAAKAAADKAAADKLASDKATADQAAADKLAADKLVADKAAADKAAADKVIADKAAADKAAADKTAASAAIKNALKLPDKSTLDPALTERTAAILSELGLTAEHAPKVFDLVVQEATAHADKTVAAVKKDHEPGGAAFVAQQAEFKAAALADPILGGGKPEQLEANMNLAKRVVATFGGTPEQVTAIEQTGFMNAPTALRLLVAVGKAMSEDKLVRPAAAGSGEKTEQERLEGLYPSMKKKE